MPGLYTFCIANIQQHIYYTIYSSSCFKSEYSILCWAVLGVIPKGLPLPKFVNVVVQAL